VQLIYQPPDAPGYGTARPGIEYNPLSEIFIVLLFYMYESRYVQYSTFVSYCVTVYSRKEVLAGLRHLRPNPRSTTYFPPSTASYSTMYIHIGSSLVPIADAMGTGMHGSVRCGVWLVLKYVLS
jgi:hypothetical protein